MIPAPYDSWPVVMSQNKAAKLMGIDRKTLAKNKQLLGSVALKKSGTSPKLSVTGYYGN